MKLKLDRTNRAVIITVSLVIILVASYLVVINAQSQDQKTFVLGENPLPVIDSKNYINGSPVLSSIYNYPSSYIVIENWSQISTHDQQQIITELKKLGYLAQ